VEHFALYDLFTPEGYVDENVFAYSNRLGDQRALVIYHNRYAETRGWVRTSVASAVKTGAGDKFLTQAQLADGLTLPNDGRAFVVFRDQATGLEYIRNSRQIWEQGLYVELGAYQCHVFLDFRLVQDDARHPYAQLAAYLNGRGVPDIEAAMQEIFLQPIHHPFLDLVNADCFRRLMALAETGAAADLTAELEAVEQKTLILLREIKHFTNGGGDETAIAQDLRRKLTLILTPESDETGLRQRFQDDPAALPTLLGWLFTHALGRIVSETDAAQISRSWLDEWLLGKIIAGSLRDLGMEDGAAWWAVTTVKALIGHQNWFETPHAYPALRAWLQDDAVRRLLQVNRYQDVLWFNQEAFEQLVWWMQTSAAVTLTAAALQSPGEGDETAAAIENIRDVVSALLMAMEKSEYRVEKLLEAAR
jgi:hypothetical protein